MHNRMGQIVFEKARGFIERNTSDGFIQKDKSAGLIETNSEGYVYMEDKTIRVGEPMGLLLCLTYPATVNFEGERI